jgi:hypothetical protein
VLKDKILHLFIGDATPSFARLPGAKKTERTVMSQDSCMVTECDYPVGNLTDMLPGGAAVIDNLAAWCHDTPGWDSILPIVNKLRTMRVPKLSPSYFPEVFELDLALADEARYKDAVRWLRHKQEEHREEYGFFIPAADVEAIQLEATTNSRAFTSLISNIMLDSEELRLPIHPGPAAGKIPGVQMPVLLMCGGIGWQFHMRISMEERSDPDQPGRKVATFPSRNTLPFLCNVLRVMEPATGAGSSRTTWNSSPLSELCTAGKALGCPTSQSSSRGSASFPAAPLRGFRLSAPCTRTSEGTCAKTGALRLGISSGQLPTRLCLVDTRSTSMGIFSSRPSWLGSSGSPTCSQTSPSSPG